MECEQLTQEEEEKETSFHLNNHYEDI